MPKRYFAKIRLTYLIEIKADTQEQAEYAADEYGDDEETLTISLTDRKRVKSIEVLEVYPKPLGGQ